MWCSFGVKCCLKELITNIIIITNYTCSLTSIPIKPRVNLDSFFLQLNNEKRGGVFSQEFDAWSGAVIVAVSKATRELHPVRKEEFDTRRSRYSKIFTDSRRRRRHVRNPHEYRDKRRDTVVNHVFFIAGSDGCSAEVVTGSWYSGAKTRTADLPLLNNAQRQKKVRPHL